MHNNASEILRNALTILFYKKRFILWTVGVCLLATTLLVLLSPKQYSGQFSVLVRASDLDTSRILPGAGVFVQPQAVNMEILTNEQSLILSDTVLTEVNRRLDKEYPGFSYSGLKYLPQYLTWLVEALRDVKKMLSAEESAPDSVYVKNEALRELLEPTPIIGTHTIEISSYFYNPEILRRIQKTLLSVYLETRGYLVTTEDTLQIYESDVAKFHKRWTALEKEKADFQVKNNLYNLPKQKQGKIDHLLSLDESIDSITMKTTELEGQLDYVKKTKNVLGLRLSTTADNQALKSLEDQIALLEVQRGKLLADYLPSSQSVKRINYAIDELTARYSRTLKNNLSSSIAEYSTRLEALKAERSKTVSELNRLEQKGGIMLDLEKKTELASHSYQTYSNKLEEVKLQKLLSTSSGQSLSVLREPFVDDKPVWPNTIILFPLALILGTFFGIIGAYISYSFEDTVLQPSDLKFTQLPVAGSFVDTSNK